MCGLSLAAVGGGAQAPHCRSLCCLAQALGAWASVVVIPWAWLPLGMWDPPRPGIKPMSPALAGGFLTIEPSGKPYNAFEIQKFEF